MFWLGTIVSTCYVPGVTGAYIATQWPMLSIVLSGLFLFSSQRGPRGIFQWATLGFLTFALVHLVYVPLFDDGVFGVWLIFVMTGSFWLGGTLYDLRSLYTGLALGASISSAIAIFQHFGMQVVPQVPGFPAGLYVNSVSQGMIMALLIVALVSERMWFWVPTLLPGLLLSQSRGAWVALAVGLLAVYVRRTQVLGAIAVVGAFFMMQSLAPSDEMRLFIWNAAIHNLTWLGWGPGSFTSWLLDYKGFGLYPEYAHNDALQFIFEYGVGALFPIGLFSFVLTRTKEREWPLLVAFTCVGCYSMPSWVPVVSFIGYAAAGRVVRSWALARDYGYGRRLGLLARAFISRSQPGSSRVSVVAHS